MPPKKLTEKTLVLIVINKIKTVFRNLLTRIKPQERNKVYCKGCGKYYKRRVK